MTRERGPQGQTPENRVPQPASPSILDRWFYSRRPRRQAIQEAGVGLAGAAAGFLVGQELHERAEQSIGFDDPTEIQIKRLELRNKEGLKNNELLERFTFLVAWWYGYNHSFGAMAEPDDQYAVVNKMYAAVHYIKDPNDPNLGGQEGNAGWTVDGDDGREVWMNLTSSDFSQEYTYTATGGTITPLMQYRDTLVHEFTHYITKKRDGSQAFDLIKQQKPEFTNMKAAEGSGFRIYFDPNPDDPDARIVTHLADFDEAATELIANYYQRSAGLAIGLPTYPEANQSEGERSQIERTLDTLEATLQLAGISMDKFAELHKESDLDGLTKLFADRTNKTFATDTEKIDYGLSIIDALRTDDRKTIGEFIQNIKS